MKYKIIYITLIVIIIFILYDLIKNYSTIINIKQDNFINYHKNKKVAILISGQIRENYYQILMIQKLFIVDLYNADVFCSFSDDVNDNIKYNINKILKPTHIEWITSDNEYNITDNITYNSYLMFKKIYLCNQYKLKYEKTYNFKYDIVIRIRPDIFISSIIPNIDFTQNILYLPDYHIKFIKYITRCFSKTPDAIAMCNSYVMDLYSNIYKYFIEKIKINKIIIPEILLEKYLLENLIKFQSIKYPYVIYKYSYNSSFSKNVITIKYFLKKTYLYYKNKNVLK